MNSERLKEWDTVKVEVENLRRAQLSTTVAGSSGSPVPMEVDSLARQVNALSSQISKLKGKPKGKARFGSERLTTAAYTVLAGLIQRAQQCPCEFSRIQYLHMAVVEPEGSIMYVAAFL